HPCEPEVEYPHRHVLALGEEHVRRLDVTVEDAGRVSVRERLADLRAGLDRVAILERAGPQRLPHGPAGNELVRDVHVPRIARKGVRAQAGRVAQARRGGGLALGARRGLALAGHDLEGEDQPAPLRRERSIRHWSGHVGRRRVISSLAESPVTVWPERPTA